MYLGTFKKKVSQRFFNFGLFPFLGGIKIEKMTILSNLGQNLPFFQLLSPLKMKKIQNSKICWGTFFLTALRYMHTNFQVIRNIFQTPDTIFVQSWGTIFFLGDGSKNALFWPKKGQFLKFFDQIFRIHKNHINTYFDQFWA